MPYLPVYQIASNYISYWSVCYMSSRPSFCFKSSLFELARLPDFADFTVIPEDAVRDRGASFAVSEPDCVHVVVDRHLITGQNEASTLTAVQNLVLLCNQR